MLFLACRFPTPGFISICHIHKQKIGHPDILRSCLLPLHHQEVKCACRIVLDLYFLCCSLINFVTWGEISPSPSLSWADKIGLKFVVKIDLTLHVSTHQSDA